MFTIYVIAQIIFGILLADLISGFIHFAQDNLGSSETPIFGSIIHDGRSHHRDPDAFLRSRPLDRSSKAIGLSMFAGGILALIFGPQIWVISATLAGALMIEIQVLAHRPKYKIPKWAQVLQWIGIIQRGSQHSAHHAGDGDIADDGPYIPPVIKCYCVITNWLNPILDRTQLWPWLYRITRMREG